MQVIKRRGEIQKVIVGSKHHRFNKRRKLKQLDMDTFVPLNMRLNRAIKKLHVKIPDSASFSMCITKHHNQAVYKRDGSPFTDVSLHKRESQALRGEAEDEMEKDIRKIVRNPDVNSIVGFVRAMIISKYCPVKTGPLMAKSRAQFIRDFSKLTFYACWTYYYGAPHKYDDRELISLAELGPAYTFTNLVNAMSLNSIDPLRAHDPRFLELHNAVAADMLKDDSHQPQYRRPVLFILWGERGCQANKVQEYMLRRYNICKIDYISKRLKPVDGRWLSTVCTQRDAYRLVHSIKQMTVIPIHVVVPNQDVIFRRRLKHGDDYRQIKHDIHKYVYTSRRWYHGDPMTDRTLPVSYKIDSSWPPRMKRQLARLMNANYLTQDGCDLVRSDYYDRL